LKGIREKETTNKATTMPRDDEIREERKKIWKRWQCD
jgi:hypothetical protein